MCAALPKAPGGAYLSLRMMQEGLEKQGLSSELLLNSRIESAFFAPLLSVFSPYLMLLRIGWKWIRGDRFRVIQIHEPSACAYALLKTIIPSLPPLCVRSHGVEILRDRAVSERSRHRRRHRYLRRWVNAMNAVAFKACDVVLVNNQADQSFLEERYGLKNVIVCGPSLDPALFERIKKIPNPAKTVVTYIGPWRHGYYKAIDVLEVVIAKTIAADPSIHFQLVGVRRDVLKETPGLADYAENIAVVKKFDAGEELATYLNRSDILISPSYYESGPRSVLEGMCFRNAVVCSGHCRLIREIARDREEAIFVRGDDPDTYVQAILELARDTRLRERLSRQGHELAKRHIAPIVVKDYAQAIRGLQRNR